MRYKSKVGNTEYHKTGNQITQFVSFSSSYKHLPLTKYFCSSMYDLQEWNYEYQEMRDFLLLLCGKKNQRQGVHFL